MELKQQISELRQEILSDENLYNALVSSIESALIESPANARIHQLAILVADRIVGKEE